MQMRRPFVPILCAAGAVCLVSAVVFVRLSHRDTPTQHLQSDHLGQLFREASGDPAIFESSEQSDEALHQIGLDGSDRATSMLIDLSTKGAQIPALDIRPAAIRELKNRTDPRIPQVLVSLINTRTEPDARKAAVETLASFECDLSCTEALLKYLDDISKGELNIESQTALSFGAARDERTKKELLSEQNDVYANIYRVLMKRPGLTNKVLADQYELGSASPQEFGVAFAVEAQDREACLQLENSIRKFGANSNDTTTKAGLLEASHKLRCKSLIPVP